MKYTGQFRKRTLSFILRILQWYGHVCLSFHDVSLLKCSGGLFCAFLICFRFNKAQQDAFLPYVEAGHIVFIGATTENPSFEINAALLSRCRVLTLNKLQPEHVRSLLDRAICHKEKGLLCSLVGSAPGDVIKVEEDALQFLANAADGDARAALNSLEIAGLAAFAAWESTPRKPSADEKPFNVNVKTDGEKDVHADGVKQESPSSLMLVPASSIKMDISGTGFGMKRLEVLKESLKKENPPNSADDYTKPFKRFVGGKEVVKGVKEVKEHSPSGGSQGDSGGYTPDVGSKDIERTAGNLHDTAGETGGSGERRNIVVTLQQVTSSNHVSPVLVFI
jgi:hypothetical protein